MGALRFVPEGLGPGDPAKMVYEPVGDDETPLYDVMSTTPYPEFPVQKIKLAMAMGDKGYCRLSQIQLRHFNQTGRDAMVRYVLDDKSRQIFASRYQFALPSEEELRAELRRELEEVQIPEAKL